MGQFTGLLGVVVLIGLCWLISWDRRRVPWKLVVIGVAMQFALAGLMLKAPYVSDVFSGVGWFVSGVISKTDAGIEFLFGPRLPDASGPWGFVFAVKVLPIIVFFAALMAALYYLGVMQWVIALLAWLLRRTLGVTGAEAMCMSANVFVGQTEAPLTVRPLIARMTPAQLMTLMVGGFATIAGSVMGAYVAMLGGADEAARALWATHLLTASVMSAPAAFVCARIVLPETGSPPDERLDELMKVGKGEAANLFDAIAAGTSDGLRLAVNVAAMLVAFVALLALLNWPLGLLGEWGPIAHWRAAHAVPPLSLETLLGYAMAPVAWTMGVPWGECLPSGSLLGQKFILTEFVAYVNLSKMTGAGGTAAEAASAMGGGAPMSERTAIIVAYALCGFANFPSIAIQIGGLSALAPARRAEFARLALRAMLAGAMAAHMTGCVVGCFYSV
ncbi:MAG: NupC/NupG family nucleoside CNT transporter [Phycisphaerales bacterium]|nr:NupC/NupG family nucleoside CNT transporter [Phycisphaerales bacterium]